MMKNQKTAKGLNFLPKLIFHFLELEKKEEALGAREEELRRKEELAKTPVVPNVAENENDAPSMATGEKIVSASSTEVIKKAPLKENSGKQPLNDATNTKSALVSPKKRSRASQEASISATTSQPQMSENDDSVTTTLELIKSPLRRSSLSKRASTPSSKVPADSRKSAEAPIIFKKKKRSRERASSQPELSKSSQLGSEVADAKRVPQKNLFESSSKKTASSGFLKPSDSRKSEEKTAIIFKKKKRVRTGSQGASPATSQEAPASIISNQPESSENSKAAALKSTQESMTDSVMNLYEQADRMRIHSQPRNVNGKTLQVFCVLKIFRNDCGTSCAGVSELGRNLRDAK